jgi:hypothetical protein
MMRWGSTVRALMVFPRRVLDQGCRAFSDAAAAEADAAPSSTRSQRQKQAKAEAVAKAAEAKPAPPDFIGDCSVVLYPTSFDHMPADETLASFQQNGSRCARMLFSLLQIPTI